MHFHVPEEVVEEVGLEKTCKKVVANAYFLRTFSGAVLFSSFSSFMAEVVLLQSSVCVCVYIYIWFFVKNIFLIIFKLFNYTGKI